MSIIIFIIILSALVIVHELGHFLIARHFGIRVDEFGLGFPPRVKKLFVWKGTPFTLNWLPFGGFVKIFGEEPSQDIERQNAPDSMQSKNKAIQAAVLISGVTGNFLFAWLLISIGFMIGLPTSNDFSLEISNSHITIIQVFPDSPAEIQGLKTGDIIRKISRGETEIVTEKSARIVSPEEVSEFISQSAAPLTFEVTRNGENISTMVTPKTGLVEGRPAIGIALDLIGIAKLSPPEAIWQGMKTTWQLTQITTEAILGFVSRAIIGRADLSSVSGPVGIVGMVGEVTRSGFANLLTFTALISINLSIINLLPFPALDGGRLLFVVIETVIRKPVPPRLFNALNAAGFGLLILLMILVTVNDLRNIF